MKSLGIEIWVPVKKYEGAYEVSSFGRIRSLDRLVKHSENRPKRIKGKVFTLNPDRWGYCSIDLCRNHRKEKRKVHRLVAEAFIPNPENKPEVNHIDGIKTNNSIDNLEWCTSSENQLHAFKNKLQIPITGEKCYNSKLTDAQVLEIKSLLLIKGGSEIARMYNVARSTICDIKNNRTRRSHAI